MSQKCSYTYRGKTYSTERLMRTLVDELPSRSQAESIEFLKDYLGMSEQDITVIKGLIDNKSLGRFKADGKMLLSDLANVDVAYHEAFHRVWRMYLSPEERLLAIQEIKSRKNIDTILDQYQTIYPDLSRNDLIEEFLADEFADYVLNANYKIETPVKTLFAKLINFLKSLIGLKPNQTQMIYDKILSKSYVGAPKSIQEFFKDADKVLIKNVEFTIEQKNELVSVLTQQFIDAVLKVNGDVDAFLNSSSTKVKDVLADYVVPTIAEQLLESHPDLGEAFFTDVEEFTSDPTAKFESSLFVEAMVKNLKLIGLNIKDETEDLSEGALEEQDVAVREFAPSIEMDPKSKMGGKIKLLLSSLADSNVTTPNFGFPKPVGWTKSFVQIAMKMAGVPTSVFMDELKKSGLSYAQGLIDVLNKDSIFKNKFINTLAMTENKFLKMMYKKGDIYFFNANSGTREDKLVGEWTNNFLRRSENWEQWLEDVKDAQLKITKTSDEELAELFGIELNPAITDMRETLKLMLEKVSRFNKEKPDSRSVFKDLDIKGSIAKLAHAQAKFEDALDLMVNLGGKKLYTLGLNTQQTTVINAIRYAQTLFTDEMSQTEKIEILKQFAEFQVSEFNITKLQDGTYRINNKWLEKILNGEQLELVIPYIAEIENREQTEIAKMDEADLMAMHINGALQGINMSMKHGDRSTFFAYTFGNKPLYGVESATTETGYLDILVDNIKEQIELEIKLANKLANSKLSVQYIGKNSEGAFTKAILGDKEFEKLLNGGQINKAKIYEEVQKYFQDFKKDVRQYGLLNSYSSPVYKDGKRNGQKDIIKGINNSLVTKYTSTDLLLAAAFVNEVSNHIFEMRFFSGDVRVFQNGSDLFKRMNPQSSTGNLSVNSVEAQMDVKQRLDQDFDVINPMTGEALNVNPASFIEAGKEKYFRAVTAAERKNYESHLNQPATTPSGKPIISQLTGKQESKLFMLFEHNFIADFPTYSLDELRTLYKPKFELYEEKYKGANENDGQSYMTLPAFKNFMIRQGNWTDGMETIYQIEMKIASLKSKEDIANLEVTIKGKTFKPFEVKSQEVNGKKIDGWKNRIVDGKLIKMDAVHTLKTQFGGYSVPEEYFDDVHGDLEYLFNSVFKTSQHILIPSAIMGTNLQLMNFSMLSNGIDIMHMGSANKVGGVDPKLAAQAVIKNQKDTRNSRVHLKDIAERGLDFYNNDGYFNHEALNENKDILTYLSNWDFLKDQVKIGNKVKSEIKGSTQSLKILLSNLVVNGNQRFKGASDLVESYKEIIDEMVKTNRDNLLSKIGYNLDTAEFDSLDKLKDSILNSSQMLAAPDNIRNSIQNFFEDPSIGIEAVPMKNKIENVLYSLITNGIISFDRPGSSYPQAAVTGYEKLGSRKFNTEGVQTSNQDTLKFYDPVFDEDGNLVTINPAEVIMPLPDYWIKPLLRWAKTNNLAKALDMLNADIAVRPELYQFKGLRIPNQQLSSNDIFQVKKFNLPTVQNYIVIPTEMVIKTGGDFDIDKLNIYWAEDTQNKIFGSLTEDEYLELYETFMEESEEVLTYEDFKANYGTSVDRILLEKEKEIILHPRNAHQLLMPLTDEIFVKDIYNDLLSLEVIKPVSSSYFSSMLPSTNVKNTVVFVKGKYGVGPVALAITNAATNQADVLSINDMYNTQDGTISPTKLLFEGMGQEYSLDNYTDNKGTVISEILSQLLTTQVDNVKNPTAVLMNINMQTLGVMLYLIRRKINPRSIVLFLQQPIIAKYLQYQRANESLFNKQADAESKAKGDFKSELSKNALLSKLLKDLGYRVSALPDVYQVEEGKDQLVIKDKEMLDNAQAQKFDDKQLEYLSYFLELQSQSRAFSDFQQTQNSDTKGLKDKQMLDETYEINGRVFKSQIISEDNVARLNYRGVISPFYKYGRANYSIFNRFYSLSDSLFGSYLLELKSNMASVQKGDGKDKVRQTIENDFMLFLVHHFMTNKSEFDKLMKGSSVAKRVLDLKTKLPQNLVLKAFFPMINNSIDQSSEKPERMDNLRLFERELNELDSNDMRISLEEIQETDPELYKDIIKLLMFQTGLNISPFNYRAIVPVGLNKNRNEFNDFQYLYQDLLHDAMKEMKKQITSKTAAKDLFEQFKMLFAANNVKFLESSFTNKNYTLPLIKAWDRKSESWVLKPQKGNQEQPILGDAYHKQYFVSLINNKIDSKNNVETKDILNEVFEDYQDVPTPIQETPVSKYELFPGVFANQGQTEALDLLEKFLSSNEQEFTLIGRGGTGKTTIIKKVLENLKGRSVMGITVAHKAKKVLGRSIGKDKVKTFASATANKMNESTGKFEPDMYARQQGRVPISQADVIIVDEASMISPKMRDEINTLIQRGAKVIYMGDNAQLPPVGESEDSPVFNNKNQYTLKEKMRQAKTSPIIGIGSTIAENIESPNLKTVAIKSEDRKSKFDEVSKSEVVFISEESQALDLMVEDIKNAKNNPDFVKAVTFNNENHNAPQSVKNLNSKIRAKLWGDKASNQLNVGEMLTAYDSYATVKNPTEDDMIIHNSEDFIVKAFSKRTAKNTVTVSSKAKGERSFRFEYDVLDVELINDEGKPIKGHVVEMIADSSKAQFDADLAKLWKEDTQLAIALKGKFANLQYGYAITSHKAQGSTYTNTYVFEDNILGPTNGGDAITKNKSLYVAVSRPTTKLVMISERNEGVAFEDGKNYLTEGGKKIGSLETDEFGFTYMASPKVEKNVSIVKNNWTKDSPKENPNTAYIFTENINSIGSSRVGGGSAIIRNNPNAIGIVTKKYYVYSEDRATSKVTGGWNQDFQNTEADFDLFKKVNLEQFAKIDKYETKIFPQGFASDLAKIPTRFAEWLQNELLSRYGLVTELNSTKTGLISKSVTSVTQSTVKKSINIYAGTNENAELSNFAVRPFTATLGVKPLGKFQTVEGAFQAAKFLYTDEGLSDSNKNILKELQTASGSKAKSVGRNIQNLNKEEWDENSSEIMKDLIKQSFEQNPDALSKLLVTGNATLTHTQDKGKWGTEFPKLLMEVRSELRSGYQTLFQADRSRSQYSPSLKLYEGFVNLNQLYQGDEILPFIGESEYYRYLVPMLLKMNPKAQTVFTDDMKFVVQQLGTTKDMQVVTEMNRMPSGMSAKSLNRNFVNFDAKSKTVVHELVHLTLQKEYEKGTEFKTKIDELFSYAWDRQESDGTYGFASPKEFLAEAMSNPDFMKELNEIKYKEETVWSYLMTLVSDFINTLLNVELKSDSVLAEVVRLSEQVLNRNISEIGKETKVDSTTLSSEIFNNWSSYFPDFEWMNEAQRRMTAKLAEEGKITLTCNL